jgi:hypothetical protein
MKVPAKSSLALDLAALREMEQTPLILKAVKETALNLIAEGVADERGGL